MHITPNRNILQLNRYILMNPVLYKDFSRVLQHFEYHVPERMLKSTHHRNDIFIRITPGEKKLNSSWHIGIGTAKVNDNNLNCSQICWQFHVEPLALIVISVQQFSTPMCKQMSGTSTQLLDDDSPIVFYHGTSSWPSSVNMHGLPECILGNLPAVCAPCLIQTSILMNGGNSCEVKCIT